MDKTIEEIAAKFRLTPEPCAFVPDGSVSCGMVAHLAKDHFTEPEAILCKWCGSKDVMKYGIRYGNQEYICKNCKRKFNVKDAPHGKQTPAEQIGASLSQYYDGLSLADIVRQLQQNYNNPVNLSTVYRWLLEYTQIAKRLLDPLKPKVSDIWVVDETVIKIAGNNVWFWDVIDSDTRFLLASHLSKVRTINDVVTVMERARRKANQKSPHVIISDSLAAYPEGLEQVFGADSEHIQSWGMTQEINTNLIERFHGTIKERTKVLRGFKRMDTAELILDGFLIHYNFFKPHMGLKDRKPKGIDKTPAEVAGINAPAKTWLELVKADVQRP
ncbi:MAG: IS6 family transposase [Chloroflexi bacterium]|nr:IS6 family transposase [Chloroflexota bacterium]